MLAGGDPTGQLAVGQYVRREKIPGRRITGDEGREVAVDLLRDGKAAIRGHM